MKSFIPPTVASQVFLWRRSTRTALMFVISAASLAFTTSVLAINITTASLPTAVVGTAYNTTLTATGGTQPYTWKLVSGGFPGGLSLNTSTGVISGMPSVSGSWEYSYPFRVYISVKDAVGATTAVAFNIAIQPPANVNHTLTVVNGSGSGSFAAGVSVNISANAPPTGQVFQNWTGASVANPNAASTTLVMPNANVTVTAHYTNAAPPPVTQYTLTVVNGSGGGSYAAGASVAIAANAAPANQVFQNWTGAAVANAQSANTTLTMPAANTTVTANYVAAPPPPPPPAAPLATQYAILDPVTVGTPYTRTVTATGGTPPYTWSVSVGTITPGMSITPGGVFSGTPTTGGDFQFTLTVTDSVGATASIAEDQWVNGPAGSGGGSGGSGGGGNPPPPPPPPVATYTVTVTNGTANGVASGTFNVGTVVTLTANAAPAGQYFQQWIGNAPVANSLVSPTQFVMPANNVNVSATFYTPAPIPQPVATHPRLWLTPADATKYQGWVNANNPLYQQGLLLVLNQVISDYNNKFFPGGQPNPNYPDLGDTQGYQGLLTEQEALVFALFSLIDPNPAARIVHAQRARNLIMYALNIAAQGPLAGAPFRDPLFVVYNRGNFTSEAWPLVVDWIYNAQDSQGNPILTAADKATIRNVFLQWANTCINANTTGGDHPSPLGVANTPLLLPGGNAYRMASNNYYLGHARLVTLMSLCIDPADDPAVNPATPDSVLGNTLRSYITNATGAWLYQEFAMLGDPATVRAAFNLGANTKVGLASGGLPPEGMLYGHSYSYILGQLLALKTAGFADSTLIGPQALLANNAPVWDRFMKGMATSIVPSAQTYPGWQWMGPVYQVASYGDVLRMWITPDFAQTFGLLGLLDQKNNDLSRQNAERWFVTNAIEGGSANLISRVANPWSYGVEDALLTFLLLDPAAAPATDPRPSYPTAFYDAPQGRLVEHTSWSPNATMFDFRCSWISINHQQADANQFEFYRKGEWLTKGVANYDNNIGGLLPDYHNTLSIQNWCANGTPTDLGWWEPLFWTRGGQWQLGRNAGDPTTTASVQTNYTFVFGDTTNLYNKPNQWTAGNNAMDVLHASRSLLWLKPDHIVVYDRATSHTPGLFKRFNLAFTAPPLVNGNLLTTTTPNGQHLYVSTLLPAGATATTSIVGPELNPIAMLEPANSRVAIETNTNLTDVRFLHVLQGADGNVAAEPTTLVQSSAGTAFDGAFFVDTVVMFQRDVAAAFTSLSYTVPVAAAHHYVTGLAPGAGYTVTATSDGVSAQLTITSGGAIVTDSAGVLTFDLANVLP